MSISLDEYRADIQEKVDDYLSFGTPFVWLVSPRTKRGYVYTPDGMREAKDGVLRTNDSEIALPLSEIF
jgi:Uma2 family endonuclease